MTDFAPMDEVLREIREGRMIVLVDDEQRENEGDLVMAAERVTPEAINFMITHGRGILCLALTDERCRQLELPLMDERNSSRFGTAFTVSVDAAHGVTTGTSAHDRAQTVLTAIADDCRPADLARPGHIFPIRARLGGVLVRAGHTEGSVDLAAQAGLKPAAVICEILAPDGTMARLPQLQQIAREHGLKVASIADVIAHRRRSERLIEKVVIADLPTRHGKFRIHCYRSLVDDYLHLALCSGDVGESFGGATLVQDEPVLVRVHSECLTGDIFHSHRCDCGEQTEKSLEMIARFGRGVFLYIRQEGRGIGLVNKLKSYALQDKGLDTVEANQQLGFPPDLREYGIGAQILTDLGLRRIRVMSNNPHKFTALAGYGLRIASRVPLVIPPNPENALYLKVKREKLGHLLG